MRTARLNWANPIIEIPAARPFCLGWIFGAGDEFEQFEREQENMPILQDNLENGFIRC